MELHEALSRIEVIRRQMARTETFDGYRAVPTAVGSLLATSVAVAQPHLVPRPDLNPTHYVLLWSAAAAIVGGISAGDAWRRHRGRRSLSGMLTQLAFEQFAPCVVAGAALTAALVAAAPQSAWLLPGLWAVVFALGLFASLRLLPRWMFVPAAWYLASGCAVVALGPERAGTAPWTMAALFGVGQAGVAAVLANRAREQRALGGDFELEEE